MKEGEAEQVGAVSCADAVVRGQRWRHLDGEDFAAQEPRLRLEWPSNRKIDHLGSAGTERSSGGLGECDWGLWLYCERHGRSLGQ